MDKPRIVRLEASHLIMPHSRRSRRLGHASRTLLAAAFPAIAALVPMSGPGNDSTIVAGAAGGSLARVKPDSVVVNQYCPSAAGAAPHSSRSPEPASLDPALFTISSPLRVEASGADNPEVRLHLDEGVYDVLKKKERVVVQDFVLDQGKSVRLDLRRVEICNDQTVFVTGTPSGDKPAPSPDVILLVGSVQGVPGSSAFLGLSQTGVNGYVRLGDSTYVLSSGPPRRVASQGPGCVVSNLHSLDGSGGTPWSCQLDETLQHDQGVRPASGSGATGEAQALRVCNVAIDCDYQYFLMMGEDESAALDYVATLLAAASSIYERDVGVSLRLSYARVWTTQDPYQTCGWDGLTAFQSAFQPTGPTPNVGFKFSGCGGAAAAIGIVSCGTNGGGSMPVAAGRISGFFPYPIAPSEENWDLYVVAHEIGHMLGSPHTHCYSPPLDSCKNTEETCYNGPVVCSRGSIMSYCNQCGGMSNIDLEFPPRVAERMAQVIAAACMDVTDGVFYICNDDARVVRVDSITTVEPWLGVSHSTFLVASADSQRVAILCDWDNFVTLQQAGRVRVFFDGHQSPVVIAVTANRQQPFAAFTASSVSGCAPLAVQFTDETIGQPTAWLWRFGDGGGSSAQNPIHVYTIPGTYAVGMGVSNSCGASGAEDALITVTGPACLFNSPIIINRGDSLIRSYDLWPSAGDMAGVPDSLRFEIAAVSRDSCGARIDNNRYLSVSPVRGWAGNSLVTVRTFSPRGCTCEAAIGVIVNVPPTIEIQSPDETIITNSKILISWVNENPDDEARIMLYRSERPDCSDAIAITGKPLLQNQVGAVGRFVWAVSRVPDGQYYIKAVITDQASSAENCSRGSVVVDLTPPVTAISTYCSALDSNGWCRSDGVVTLTAVDNLTGVGRTLYRVNTKGWALYHRPFRVDAQGASTVEYFSVDVAGNTENLRVANQPFKIDTRTPYISSLSLNNDGFVDGDYMSTSPTFSFQLLDDGSGIDLGSVRVIIEPGTVQGSVVISADSAGFSYDTVSYTARVSTPAPLRPGRQTVTVGAADRVGNIATATVNFQVDPILRLENVVTFPNPTRGPAQFTFKLTQEASVSIRVYDLSGSLVRHMTGIACKAGYNSLPWDGWSDGNGPLASGAYVYEITAVNGKETAKRLEKLAILR